MRGESMPLKSCIICGAITDKTRCPTHRLGYSTRPHRRERDSWKPSVEAGRVTCRRAPYGLCVADEPVIQPGESWHLGHPDNDCPAPTAPEHVSCNSGAPRRRVE